MKKLIVIVIFLVATTGFCSQYTCGKAEKKIIHTAIKESIFENKDYGVINNEIFFIKKNLFNEVGKLQLVVVDYATEKDPINPEINGRLRVKEQFREKENREFASVHELGAYYFGTVEGHYIEPAFYFKSGFLYFPAQFLLEDPNKVKAEDIILNQYDGKLFLLK